MFWVCWLFMGYKLYLLIWVANSCEPKCHADREEPKGDMCVNLSPNMLLVLHIHMIFMGCYGRCAVKPLKKICHFEALQRTAYGLHESYGVVYGNSNMDTSSVYQRIWTDCRELWKQKLFRKLFGTCRLWKWSSRGMTVTQGSTNPCELNWFCHRSSEGIRFLPFCIGDTKSRHVKNKRRWATDQWTAGFGFGKTTENNGGNLHLHVPRLEIRAKGDDFRLERLHIL